MTLRGSLSVVLAISVATVLAACAPAAAPAPSPTETSSAPTTPPPTTEPVAASVAITAEAITVLDADGGALATFDYFQPTTEVVDGLTALLGTPVDSPNPGGIETPPGVDHMWGDLRLFDTDTPGAAPYTPNHYVFVTGPAAGSVPIATAAGVGSADGIAVGDPATELTIGVEAGAPYTDPATGRTSLVSTIGIVPLPAHPDDPAPRNFAVMVVSYTDTGLIERLVAPSANFGV